VSQNGYLLSRRGRILPANASGFATHRDSISSRFDCRSGGGHGAMAQGEPVHRLYYAAADGHHSSVRHNKISVASLRQVHRSARTGEIMGLIIMRTD
jgi:hypothetical protein